MTIVVRQADLGHVTILAELHRQAFVQRNTGSGENWNSAAFAELLAMPGAFALFAMTESDQPVGFILMRVAGDEAEILSLGVEPGHRFRGVGNQLLQTALDTVRLQGAHACFLEVAATNQAALALYRNVGFRQNGCRKGYYRNGQSHEDALIMKLLLIPAKLPS